MFLQLVAEVACARLSISADKGNKPASSQIANGRKTAGIKKGRAWKHFFKYVKYQPTFWKNRFSCQNVKFQNVRRWDAGGYRVSHARHVCARQAKWLRYVLKWTVTINQSKDWFTRKTNWKWCLQAPLRRLSPTPTRFSMLFPHYIHGSWNWLWQRRLGKKMFVYHPLSLFITWRFEGTNFRGWKILRCLKSAFKCMKLILSVPYQSVSELTLLLVMQTGDHIAVPKERDRTLTTPTESTVTGVPTSENLRWKRASNG